MKVTDFDFELPAELIAQQPPTRRGRSRLLVVDRSRSHLRHARFADIREYFQPGDALVINTTKVFKARLWGQRATGGRVEVFLVRQLHSDTGDRMDRWLALVSPSRRVKEAEAILFGDRQYVMLDRFISDGSWEISFSSRTAREKIIAEFGHVPLPPYIRREDTPTDSRRYQTVFADRHRAGAVAAPTAGLHFTRKLLEEIENAGVVIAPVTLHVGPGTFKPISTEDIEAHVVDPEYAELPVTTAEILNGVRRKGGRVMAVGTTSVRTLESAPIQDGSILPFGGLVDLYIRPGYRFKVVDRLVTNFHLPKSSLLVLVSAFMGREQMLQAYGEAVCRRYRFYSYGDAMLII